MDEKEYFDKINENVKNTEEIQDEHKETMDMCEEKLSGEENETADNGFEESRVQASSSEEANGTGMETETDCKSDVKVREVYYDETIKKKTNNTSFKKFIAACVIVSMVGGSFIGIGYAAAMNLFFSDKTEQGLGKSADQIETNYVNVSKNNDNQAGKDEAVNVIKSVAPAIISITTKASGTMTYFGSFLVPYESEGAGSGVIFFDDGEKIYIATNAHVVSGATELWVSFDDENLITAKIIGSDSSADLAVVSVNKSDLKQFGIDEVTIATFGDSDLLEVGETVIAIGNALGEGKTSTRGMISATDKNITVDGTELDVIQTDAAINPGNSGGALVNFNGEVVGINTAKAYESGVENMGYAIPSNIIVPIIEKLLEEGTSEKPYLGIFMRDITEDLAKLYGLPVGVFVEQVISGSGAEAAGIKSGDIIIELGGYKTLNTEALQKALAEQKVGDTIDVKLIRNGTESVSVKVKLQDANNR